MSQKETTTQLSTAQKIHALIVALLGWTFAGTIMSLGPLVGRAAIRSFGFEDEAIVGRIFSWWIAVFLLGATCGGLLFGWVGDRFGRTRGMAFSILWYSLFTGATYWVDGPAALLTLRFIACMGVGGVWPNGVALVSEVWSNVSRPFLAGVIGAAANVGFFVFARMMGGEITEVSWREAMLICTAPAILGVWVFIAVPESSRWLAARRTPEEAPHERSSPLSTLFTGSLAGVTILGIFLGTVPLLGGWGSGNWVVPWAGAEGGPELRADVQAWKSAGGVLGSLLAGVIASHVGRRLTYFLISLGSLAISLYIFHSLTPLDPQFKPSMFVLGFFGIMYFGWLPYYLPELFPTRVRATGSGVAFNFGRILSAIGVFAAGEVINAFGGDYAKTGQVTSWVFMIGMIVILFAPDTSKRQLED